MSTLYTFEKANLTTRSHFLTGAQNEVPGNEIQSFQYHASSGQGKITFTTTLSTLDIDALDIYVANYGNSFVPEFSDGVTYVIEEQRPQGVHGGQATIDTFVTRQLNTLTLRYDESDLLSLNGSTFAVVLKRGIYRVQCYAPVYGQTGNHVLRLFNLTTNATEAISHTFSEDTTAVMDTVITVNVNDEERVLQHQLSSSNGSVLDFGRATGLNTETYSRLIVTCLR